MYPKIEILAPQIQDRKRLLSRQEFETMADLDGKIKLEISRKAEYNLITWVCPEKLLWVRVLGLRGADINDRSIEIFSQCGIEELTLGLDRGHGMVLHRLLQESISKSLRRLKVENVEYLAPEDIQALGRLSVLEEIYFVGSLSAECLYVLIKNNAAVQALWKAKVKMQMWRLRIGIVGLLCKAGIDELELRNASEWTVVSLFSLAAERRLAERLESLKLRIRRQEQTALSVSAVPFKRLRHLSLDILSWDGGKAVFHVLGDEIRNSVSSLFIDGRFLRENDKLLAIEGFENLEALWIARWILQEGDIAWMLSGKKRLARLVLEEADSAAGITDGDVEAIVRMKSLREVTINNCSIDLVTLEALVGNREFVSRLARLKVRVTVIGGCECGYARLKALGMVCERGDFVLDTGKIDIAIEM